MGQQLKMNTYTFTVMLMDVHCSTSLIYKCTTQNMASHHTLGHFCMTVTLAHSYFKHIKCDHPFGPYALICDVVVPPIASL